MCTKKLANKVAVVTGGGRGMGRGISLTLAEEGAKVVIVDKDIVAAKTVAEEITNKGSGSISIKTDVSKSEDVQNMVNATLKEFGEIDILVNNAGIISLVSVVELNERDWDNTMQVNAKGVFLCSQAVARQMIKQRSGKIINTSSLCGKVGYPLLAHYCASKFAIIGFTQALALELAQYNITVNAICPGTIETDMLKREYEWESKRTGASIQELRENSISNIPLGRIGMPNDVARVVLFLASSDADYLTGQTINVNGGLSMH